LPAGWPAVLVAAPAASPAGNASGAITAADQIKAVRLALPVAPPKPGPAGQLAGLGTRLYW
jgi:hypothetical protein